MSETKSACRFVVEMQDNRDGYRFWSSDMSEDAVNEYIDGKMALDYTLSDIDHAGGCVGTCSDPL